MLRAALLTTALLTATSSAAADRADAGASPPAAVEPLEASPSATPPPATEPAPAPTPTPSAAPAPTPTPSAAPAPTPSAASPAPDAADDGSSEEAMFALEEVWSTKVVTASGGVEEDALSAAANVFTIGRQDIARRGYRSLAEVLNQVPGLFVVDDLVVPTVNVRGVSGGLRAGSRIIKVMIDGREVSYRPELTAFLGPEFIPMDLVERVEVARGPLSAIYGANAFLATVNVITQKPKGPTGTLLLRHQRVNANNFWGQPGTAVQATAGWGSEKASVLAGLHVEQTDRSGLSVTQSFPEQHPDSPAFRAFFREPSRQDLSAPVSGFLTATLTPTTSTSINLQAGLQILDSMAEFRTPSSVLTHGSRVAYRNAYGQLKWQQLVGDRFTFSLQGGVSQGAPTRDLRLLLTDHLESSYTQNDAYLAVDVAGLASYRLLDHFTLTGGVDFTHETHDVLFYTQHFNQAQGAFQPGDVQDIIGAGDSRTEVLRNLGVRLEAAGAPFTSLPGLTLSAGVRADFPNLFNWQPSARLAAAYRWTPGFSTKLILGRAFQTPSATMLFGRSGFGNSSNLVGNRVQSSEAPVQPQVVTSAEVVASAKVGERLLLDAAAYFQRVDDLVFFKKIGANFVATNRGDASVVGVELHAKFAFDYVWPYAIFSSQVVLPNADRPQATFAAESFPAFVATVGSDVRVPKAYLQGNVQARVVGPRGATQANVEFNNLKPYTLPTYVMLDLGVSSLGFTPFGGTFEPQLGLTLKNLLDARPAEPHSGGYDLPSLGRTLQLDLRFNL